MDRIYDAFVEEVSNGLTQLNSSNLFAALLKETPAETETTLTSDKEASYPGYSRQTVFGTWSTPYKPADKIRRTNTSWIRFEYTGTEPTHPIVGVALLKDSELLLISTFATPIQLDDGDVLKVKFAVEIRG